MLQDLTLVFVGEELVELQVVLLSNCGFYLGKLLSAQGVDDKTRQTVRGDEVETVGMLRQGVWVVVRC